MESFEDLCLKIGIYSHLNEFMKIHEYKRSRSFFDPELCHFDNIKPSPQKPLGQFWNYAPNFGEVEGAYWFGPVRPSVRLSVCPSVTLFGSWETQELLMLGSWNFICGMYMKNKRTRIFSFFRRSRISRVMPLFRLSLWNLVNKISQEPLMLGSWFFAGWHCPRCRWPD